MMSCPHTYRGKKYTIEREVQGWRVWCENYPCPWEETREEAVKAFEKWVDRNAPLV